MEIGETEEDRERSVDELRRYYKEFARTHLRDKPYLNKNTGWKIRVSAQGIGEIKKFRKREHIILVRILNAMLENSTFIETVADDKQSPGIENVSYFSYPCTVNGKAYKVILTIKKAFGDEVRFFYYYKLKDG